MKVTEILYKEDGCQYELRAYFLNLFSQAIYTLTKTGKEIEKME